MKHLLTLLDYSTEEIQEILQVGIALKNDFKQNNARPALLERRVAAMIFEKPSLRTRVSFETGMQHLGGSCLYLSGSDVGWGGKRESMQDFARVLSSYVDLIICRAKSHQSVEELSRFSSAPVINALTDIYHPCQALADCITMIDHSDQLTEQKLAFVGDANNVSRSLAILCAKLGVEFNITGPDRFQFDERFFDELKKECPDAKLSQSTDVKEVVSGATFVYTDVWTSMGQESEQESRLAAFQPYQVNEDLMNLAQPNAKFLHCLPAIRGQEVTDEVMDSPNSLVVEQAENRLHAQKGLMKWLIDHQNK